MTFHQWIQWARENVSMNEVEYRDEIARIGSAADYARRTFERMCDDPKSSDDELEHQLDVLWNLDARLAAIKLCHWARPR